MRGRLDFLTGDKSPSWRFAAALHRSKEGHVNTFIVGNENTGLWKKVRGIGSPDEIAAAVESVLADNP